MSDLGFKGFVPGAWRVPTDLHLTDHVSTTKPIELLPNLAFMIPNALSKDDCGIMRQLFAEQTRAPVSVSGYQTADHNEIGSQRATGWGPELSKQLWRKIKIPVWEAIIKHWQTHGILLNDFTPTDWFELEGKRKEHKDWFPTGISPVLRFMEYKAGGKHNTHYDMCYDYEAVNPSDPRRTLLSIVWYLNEEQNTGGATRFIEDGQSDLPIQKRNLDDWTRSAEPNEVIASQTPQCGGALLFWHRMAHDVQEFTGNSRIIVRGDIEFTAGD